MRDKEIEIYPARLYLRRGGWHFSILEILNFINCRHWTLFSITWDRRDGLKIEILS